MADVYNAFHDRNTYLSRKSHDKKYQENHLSLNIHNIHHIIHNICIGYLFTYYHTSIFRAMPFGILINLIYFITRYNTWKYNIYEYERETWETDNYIQGEINEMIEIYHQKYNISKRDALDILVKMSNHKNLFIDHMMVLELDIKPPDKNMYSLIHSSMYSFLLGSIGFTSGSIIRFTPILFLFPIIQSLTFVYNYNIHKRQSLFNSIKYSFIIPSLLSVFHCFF